MQDDSVDCWKCSPCVSVCVCTLVYSNVRRSSSVLSRVVIRCTFFSSESGTVYKTRESISHIRTSADMPRTYNYQQHITMFNRVIGIYTQNVFTVQAQQGTQGGPASVLKKKSNLRKNTVLRAPGARDENLCKKHRKRGDLKTQLEWLANKRY